VGERIVAKVVGTLIGAVVVFLGLLLIGLRWQVGPVVDFVRRMNRSVTNPRVMRTAGTSQTATAVIQHVGRRSGRTYETPVILAKAPEGFIAELTYGDDVNWYRNIVAAGGCVVIHHRVEYGVDQVELFEAKRGREAFPAPFRTTLQATGRSEFRLLRTESSPLLGG